MRQCTLIRRFLLPLGRPGAPSFTRARSSAHSIPTVRLFSTSLRANSVKATAQLEKRIAAIPLERFRNFCIVAHVVSPKVPNLEASLSLIYCRIMGKALVNFLPPSPPSGTNAMNPQSVIDSWNLQEPLRQAEISRSWTSSMSSESAALR